MKPIDELSEDEWMNVVQQALSAPSAPAHLVRAALGLWRTHGQALAAGAPKRRWMALLGYDSWAEGAVPAGVRALPSPLRRMLFTAGEFDIDLRIAPLAEGFLLHGQHLGPDAAYAGCEAELAELADAPDGTEPARRHVAALLPTGEFEVHGVARGTYLLTLRLGHDEIVLPPIEVGPPPTAQGS